MQVPKSDDETDKHNYRPISLVIKTVTTFSILIGYQHPDLSINWTVAHVMLVIGQHVSFCAR